MSRYVATALAVMLTALGCAHHSAESFSGKPKVSYLDRNGDGQVDVATYYYPPSFEDGYKLRDDNYDGRFETKVYYGRGTLAEHVDIPVPKKVKLESTRCGQSGRRE